MGQSTSPPMTSFHAGYLKEPHNDSPLAFKCPQLYPSPSPAPSSSPFQPKLPTSHITGTKLPTCHLCTLYSKSGAVLSQYAICRCGGPLQHAHHPSLPSMSLSQISHGVSRSMILAVLVASPRPRCALISRKRGSAPATWHKTWL